MLFEHCILHFVFLFFFSFLYQVFGRSLVLPFVNGILETKRKQDRSAMLFAMTSQKGCKMCRLSFTQEEGKTG